MQLKRLAIAIAMSEAAPCSVVTIVYELSRRFLFKTLQQFHHSWMPAGTRFPCFNFIYRRSCSLVFFFLFISKQTEKWKKSKSSDWKMTSEGTYEKAYFFKPGHFLVQYLMIFVV